MNLKRKLQFFLILLFALFATSLQAQVSLSLKTIGTAKDDTPTKIITDAAGNSYLIGHIGSGLGGATVEGISRKIEGSFIIKFDKSKKALWAVDGSEGGVSPFYRDIAVDSEGNVLVTGQQNIYDFCLRKFNVHGNLVWEKIYKPIGYHDFVGLSLAIDQHNDIYVAGSFNGAPMDSISFSMEPAPPNFLPQSDFLAKFSAQGKIVWARSSLGYRIALSTVRIDREGNIITLGAFQNSTLLDGIELKHDFKIDPSYSYSTTFIAKRDPSGKILWAKMLPFDFHASSNLVVDDNNDLYFATSFSSFLFPRLRQIDDVQLEANLQNAGVLVKVNSSGRALWAKKFPGFMQGTSTGNNYFSNLLYADNALYATGYFYGGIEIEGDTLLSSGESDIYLAKMDLKGNKVWVAGYGGTGGDVFPKIAYTSNQKRIELTASFSEQTLVGDKLAVSKGERDIFIAQIVDTSSTLITSIKGKVYEDLNLNCEPDVHEKGRANTVVKVEPGGFYTLTNDQGDYAIKVEPGDYQVSPILSQNTKNMMVRNCYPELLAQTSEDQREANNINFGYEIIQCPLLTVDIGADRRRRCMRSKTTVTYSNEGMGDAQNVRIKVLYPRYVVPIKSSLAWTSRQDSVMIFDIGTLKAGERRSFVITDSTICGNEAIRGLSQCVKALISPKSTCLSPSAAWDQSSVVVEVSLTEEDQVASFTIANQGQGDMSDSTAYRLYANEALVEQGKVKLASGAKARLAVPDPRATLRLEADQSAHHPGMSRPVASIQPAMVSPAMAAPSPIDGAYQDDADAEVSVSCLPIIDSFDPNDKQVSPQGITRRHFIKAEDGLEYQIRFQNTGTDTAYTVVVKDTLSAYVDVASLQIGSASHPFTYTVSGQGRPVLTFTFKNINLPDHKRNEPASHGYIRFRIAQTPGNPKGTVIRNLAYNYFDFNSPIATNEVFNIIGDTILASPAPVQVYDCGKQLPTAALAGEEIRLCEESETVLQANVPQHGLGRWRILSGQATLSDPTHPRSRLTAIGYGEAVLEWSIRLCEVVSRSQVKVLRYPIPAAPVITVPALQCEGSQLMALHAAGSNITWYADADKRQKLYMGNGFIPQVHATTTFYASQTVNGCESPAAAVEVKVHPATLSFAVDQDTLVGPPADSYQWYFNGQPVAGATGQKFFARNTGSYELHTTTQGCMSTSDPVDVVKNQQQAVLSLGPNPASGRLYLELAASATGEVSLVVRDRLGREVRAFKTSKPYTVLEQTLELGQISAGLYLLEVQLAGQVFTRKFVQQ